MRHATVALMLLAGLCAAACTTADNQPTTLGLSCTFDSDCDPGWICVGNVCTNANPGGSGTIPPVDGGAPLDGGVNFGNDTGGRSTPSDTAARTPQDSGTPVDPTQDVATPVDAGQPDKPDTSSGGCASDGDCDDNVACTVDTCEAGTCKNAMDGKQCYIAGDCRPPGPHADAPCLSCDPVNKPTKWTVSVGAPCDDGNTCTKNDACTDQGLCAGTPQEACCKVDADCTSTFPCTVGKCDAGTQTCSFTKTPGCCTQDSDCTGQAPACSVLFCNPIGGTCDVKAAVEGAACDDGDGCTVKDSCITGMCIGQANSCDDGNSCTSDACVGGQCNHTPINNCCTQGTCCNVATGQVKPALTPCGGPAGSEQTCQGGNIMQRIGNQACTGSDSQCISSPGHVAWGPWTKSKTCPAGTTCQMDGKLATCKSGGGACSSGTCCNTFTKQLKPKGTKCSSFVKKTEYKCFGTKIQRRRAYYGCTGKSTGCSASSLYYYWEPWLAYKTCGAGTTCKQVGSTATCSSGARKCTSGTCCNTSTKTYKTKGTKCSSSVKKTEYKCYGSKVQRRRAFYGCTGKSTSCSVSSIYYYWEPWLTYKTCSAGYTCKQYSSTYATCIKGASQCTSGTCCNTSTKTFKTKGTKCSSYIKKTEYKCYGTKIQRRRAYYGCSGSSSGCSVSSINYYWEPWTTYKTCSFGYSCKMVGSASATCSKTSSQCTSGTCCNTSTKKYKPKGTKCSSSVKKTEYKCFGNYIKRRRAYSGCSGASSSCYSSSSYYYWEPWSTYKTCSSGYTCKMVGSSYATCSKIATQCISGTCCNTATKQYKPKGYKCGSSPLKTEYMCLGSSIRRRQAYSGCSGKSTSCSSSTSYWVWMPWTTWKVCPFPKKCKTIGSSYATCS